VIGAPGNVRVYLACGLTDMRKGFDTLAAQVQTMLSLDPHNGALFAVWFGGVGCSMFMPRMA
jgi:transposase